MDIIYSVFQKSDDVDIWEVDFPMRMLNPQSG
jgi:hypothetical protein